ncbi:hypothetical protein HYX58_00295 [Candidatus Dependentiae bacterium]|nr:hypothetical protein [Candidatus Dependentiae bacterium]
MLHKKFILSIFGFAFLNQSIYMSANNHPISPLPNLFVNSFFDKFFIKNISETTMNNPIIMGGLSTLVFGTAVYCVSRIETKKHTENRALNQSQANVQAINYQSRIWNKCDLASMSLLVPSTILIAYVNAGITALLKK